MTKTKKAASGGNALLKVVRDAIAKYQPVDHSGVAVAIQKNGKLLFAQGFGWRDRTTKAPVTADTCFPIGSATKAFTSMVLSIHAATKGAGFTLDQPVVEYSPDFVMQQGRPTAYMTLVDMLAQRTGLPRNDSLWYLGPFTREQLYFRLRSLAQIPGAYGTLFLYNNLMYMTAGHLLECMTGMPWEGHVLERILKRVGMPSSSFTIAALTAGANYAKGYAKADPIPFKDYDNIAPAGAMNSTVLDLARWVQLFLNKGLTSSGDILIEPLALERMYANITDTGDGKLHYGLGWYTGVLLGKPYAFHDGVADGFTSYVSFLPEDELGVIVLTNQHTNFTATLNDMWPRKVAEWIYDYLLNGELTGLELPPFPEGALVPFLDVEAPGTAVPAARATPEDVCGIYSDPGYGDFAIGRSGGGLVISYYDLAWPMVRLSPDIFAFVVHAYGTDFPLRGTFQRDAGGMVNGFMLKLTREAQAGPVLFTRR